MEIKSAQFIISNTDISKCPQGNANEYAFIGRSNVGKSSLINMLTGNKSLAMTSSTPGKTTLINHFLINKEWYLVDLPGYGFAKRSQKERAKIQQIIEDYILERPQMANLFLLVDSRIEPQTIDLQFMEWLGEHEIPFSIVFTKTDKLKTEERRRKIAAYLDKIKETWEELPPYFLTSAEKKTGRTEILDYIEQINQAEHAKTIL
jgi:GTP-binding protein